MQRLPVGVLELTVVVEISRQGVGEVRSECAELPGARSGVTGIEEPSHVSP